MRFKVDENLPNEVKDILVSGGHEAHTVHDENIAGKPDSLISSICFAEQRAIISLDRDFADIRTYPPSESCGIIVLRLSKTDKVTVINKIREILPNLAENITGKLMIVEDNQIRIRE